MRGSDIAPRRSSTADHADERVRPIISNKKRAVPLALEGRAVVNQGMSPPSNARIDIKALTKNLRAGNRAALARAITLVESRRGDHQAAARELVQALLPDTGNAVRVGITGSPGVGKSTTIDGLGTFLIERGHMIAVNKADGDNVKRANQAAADYRSALHILNPRSQHWHPPVVTYSALTGAGVSELWQKILEHRTAMSACGEFAARRREQQVKWMWSMLEQRMLARLRTEPSVRARVRKIEAEVADGHLTPSLAAERLAEMLK